MTNFEKYRKDIEETGYRFGYNIKTNKVTKCGLMNLKMEYTILPKNIS